MSSSQGSDVVKGNNNNNNTMTAVAGKVGTLDEKIKKLTDLLGKSFRPEFIQAFSYLIELENQKQALFKLPDEVDWPKLNYFTQQLKKILKNKKHLDFLINRLLAVNSHNVHGKSVHPISSASTSSGVGMGKKCSHTNTSSLASKSAINELLDLNSRDHSSLTNDVSLNDADCFSLTHLLVRFAFKLIKFKNIPAEKANDTSFMHNLAELKLVLISCLADLSFYDDLKVQLLNDANLKCLFQLYANDTRLEIETGQKKYKDKLVQYKQPKNSVHLGSIASKLASDQAMLMMIMNSKSTPQVKEPEPKLEHFLNLENLKKLWTKMCRFSANLCQDKHAHKIKQLITDEFIVSINKFVEQLHQQHQLLCEQDKILNDSNKNETDIDFYFSLTRLLKYGCEQTTLKNLLLHNRLLVYISKYIFKLNKNLVILNDSKTSAPQMCSTENKDKTSTTTTSSKSADESQQQLQIAITKNYLVLFRDLIKQYLLLIDSWPQSAESTSTEFYNQIIEGNLIEHLLWLNMKKPQHLIEEKVDAKAELASLQFKFSQFSFHLLSKLCHEYHACRAEFGRVGGLNEYLAKIESLTDEVIATMSKLGPDVPAASMPAVLDEYEKLIDVLCVSCKESLNRLKLKENGHLLNLIKLQQKLKANKSDVNKVYKRSASTHVEFTLYNKVLAALCCFAHDQDSMNVLFSNGLIDSLLFYLTEIIESDAAGDSKEKDTASKNSSKNFENQFERLIRSDTHRRISLKKFLFNSFSDTNSASKGESKGKKRKSVTNPTGPPSKIKRVASISPLQFSSTSPVYSEASDLNEVSGTQASTSPPTLAHSESYCSLSPTNFYSPSFSLSSPPIASRCNSAVMFQQQQQLHQQSPNFYSTLSPSSSSPTYFNYSAPVEDENADEDDDAEDYINEIQFSPSIPNESSSDCDTDTDSYGSFCSEEIYTNETDAQESNPNQTTQSEDDDGDEKHEEESLIELEPGNTTLTSTSSTNIESINRTEACVFYVLSQLSHYEKAPNYFLNNFESILVCLLNYLKRASVRNPRALRILNRLTKNPNFFRHFVLAQFPYKLKKIFFNYSPAATLTSSSSSSSTTNVNSKSESDMNLYLNSNKAFFDATIFFPSFESIENTLCNNLKSLCISSSDHGYSCLISMMKQRPTIADAERLCCALVAPFVLRNSKALYYLMFELNGLDLIIDCLLTATADDVDSNKFKSIICIRRMLVFVNYKRDLKQLRDNYESVRSKLAENWKQECSLHRDETPSVKFTFGEEDRRTIVGAKDSLAGRSEYFSLLLEGPLAKNLARDGADSMVVELTDVRYETFSIIMDLLKCRVPLLEPPKLDFKLTCDLTVNLVLACDRFFLNDLKEFFICLLVFKFMSLSTVSCLFKLAWQLNHTYLANASIEFLLSEFQSFTGKQNGKQSAPQADEPSFDGFIYFLKTFLADIKPNPDSENVKSNANHHSLVDYFRKVFRIGLSEIIKNNYWKF